jgi:prolyl oligopeptidase
MRIAPLALVLAAVLALPARAPAEDARGWTYPATRTGEDRDVLHGVEVPDPYRWLEDDDAPEVVAWDQAQDQLLRAYADPVPGREAFRARIEAEFSLGGMRSTPAFRGTRRFFTERRPGQNHAVLYVEDAAGRGEPRVVIDPNAWSERGTEQLVEWFPSPDGSLVAYLRASLGSEASTLYVRDLVTGSDLPETMPRCKFASLAWAPDGKSFLYTQLPPADLVAGDEAQYHRRIRWHRLGDAPLDDAIVHGRGREAIAWPWTHTTSDRRHVLVGWERGDDFVDSYEVQWTDHGPHVKPLLVGHDSRTWVDRVGDLYLLNSDHQAPRRALYTATRETVGDPARWTRILRESGAVIEAAWPVGDRILVLLTQQVVSRLLVLGLDGSPLGEVSLPSPGSVSEEEVQLEPGTSRVWFTFESWARPLTIYVTDLSEDGFPLTPVRTMPTSVDPEALVSTQHVYASKDGTPVPIFLLHRKDTPLDGSAPTLLYGYGGFRVSLKPRYSRIRAVWADLGGVFAVANLRGGAEFGEAWHEAGSRGQKQNVFDDFIAAADWLVASGKASRERLAIQGGSNGGLLVAAVVNQRPDLCRAAISSVPLTDMLRFHRFQFAKAWTPEYGSPDVPEEFAWLKAYSPYHTVKPAAYPAILVQAGIADGRVDAFHARKIAARWQAATSSTHPVLLAIDRESGHGASSVVQLQAELLDEVCFLAKELGLKTP